MIKKNRGISSSGIGSFRPLRISEGFGGFLAVKRRALVCLWNFQGQSKKPKNSREFQKSMTSLPLFEFFSDILTQNQSVSYMSCRLFQKKSKERGWRCTFWKKKNPGVFRFINLPLEIPDNSLTPGGNSTKLCYIHHLEIPRPKIKTHGNSTWLLDHSSRNFTSFLSDPWNFQDFFSSTLRNSKSSTPLWIIFWNSAK